VVRVAVINAESEPAIEYGSTEKAEVAKLFQCTE
jgi:hypothetical protein